MRESFSCNVTGVCLYFAENRFLDLGFLLNANTSLDPSKSSADELKWSNSSPVPMKLVVLPFQAILLKSVLIDFEACMLLLLLPLLPSCLYSFSTAMQDIEIAIDCSAKAGKLSPSSSNKFESDCSSSCLSHIVTASTYRSNRFFFPPLLLVLVRTANMRQHDRSHRTYHEISCRAYYCISLTGKR